MIEMYQMQMIRMFWRVSNSVSPLLWSEPAEQRLRSACTSTQYGKGSLYPSLRSLNAVEGTCDQRRLWSDCANAQADLSLRWSHKSYGRFCNALAHTPQYSKTFLASIHIHNGLVLFRLFSLSWFEKLYDGHWWSLMGPKLANLIKETWRFYYI